MPPPLACPLHANDTHANDKMATAELWADWDPRLPISAYHYRKMQQKPPPHAVGVPAGAAWHSQSVWLAPPGEPLPPPAVVGLDDHGAVPAHDGSAVSRRRRRGCGSRPATAAAVPVVRAAKSGQAAWTARGRRLRALLSDEHAGVSELRRELRDLLLSAEAARAEAAEERREAAEERRLMATEVQGLLPPLLKEIAMLRARATFWDVPFGKDVKGDEPDDPDVQAEGYADDVLRAAAGRRAPVTVTSASAAAAAG